MAHESEPAARDSPTLVAAACCVGILTTLAVHVVTVLREVQLVSSALVAVHLALVAVSFLAGSRANGWGLNRLGIQGGPQLLRAAGLGMVYAGIFTALAGYAAWPLMTVLASMAAAVAVGAAVPTVADSMSVHTWIVRVIVAGGGIAVVVGPVLWNALAVFVRDRLWEWTTPQTAPAIRATTLVGTAAALLGAGQMWKRALDLDVEIERRARDAVTLSTNEFGPTADSESDGRGTNGKAPSTERRISTPVHELGAETKDGALLAVESLDLHYGNVQVLYGVSINVQAGEAVALLGTNGAGKTSLLRGIVGLTAPSGGRVRFAGRDIAGVPTEQLVSRGLIHVPGGRGVFPSLSVHDNLRMVAATTQHRSEAEAGIERALAAFPRLAERLNQPAGLLSGGEQQMLALSRAWVVRPRLLAIDELSLGLAPTAIDALIAMLGELRADGVAILMAEQSINVALDLADRAYFLERGSVRFEGATRDLLGRDDLLRSIFLAAAR